MLCAGHQLLGQVLINVYLVYLSNGTLQKLLIRFTLLVD